MKGALIGEKLSHSFSKEIHQFLGAEYNLIELKKEDLKDFTLSSNFDFFNVTIPYKKQIIPFLDELDFASQKIGAVNTVIVKNAKKYGYNTDYYGFKSLLEKNNIVVKDKNILILGTGGTKETVTAVMQNLGAKTISVVSRNGEINYDNCYKVDANIIVNTTPVGMYPNFDMVNLDLTKFKNLQAVVDCIYNPLKTKLILKADQLGLKACGGLYMLIAQAVYAQKLLNESLDLSIIDTIYNKILLEKLNIVLVGMPGSGKSTIGKILADKLNKTFVDSDALIVEKYGDIPNIFTNLGEETFRNYESEVISHISKQNNLIIATGGGAILRQENIQNLKHNSILVYVKRNINLLATTGRPLSKDINALAKMLEIREPIYNSCADIIVENDSDIVSVVDKVLKEIKK